MATVLLVVHIMVALSMVVIILLQRSEGGALGMGGGGGGGFVSGRGVNNLLSRSTYVLAAIFFTTSITLGILGNQRTPGPSIGTGGTQTGRPSPATADQAPSNLPDLRIRRPGGAAPTTTPAAPQATEQAPAVAAPPPSPQVPQSQ